MARTKISKDEALSFLLTYIVVEQNRPLSIDQLALYQLTTIAQQAAEEINNEEGVIPHEIIERLANDFLNDA